MRVGDCAAMPFPQLPTPESQLLLLVFRSDALRLARIVFQGRVHETQHAECASGTAPQCLFPNSQLLNPNSYFWSSDRKPSGSPGLCFKGEFTKPSTLNARRGLRRNAFSPTPNS